MIMVGEGRASGELQFSLFLMIGIKVQVTEGVNEFVGFRLQILATIMVSNA